MRTLPVFSRAVGLIAWSSLVVPPAAVHAQASANQVYDPAVYQAMQYRMIGPFRGGRVTAVDGIADQPFVFYMGSTGGGVWRTSNAGLTWTNVSDGFFEAGSIGAVEVADADPNVIYAGTGSAAIRGNVSTGIGVYRSDDGATTWHHVGLRETGQIADIVTHPRNPSLVYVAATGHAFGPNAERGVFRSTDAGATWEKVLFISDSTGAINLRMHPTDPSTLYAAMWRAERKPWTMISGGSEGGIYKTTDGGDSWTRLTGGLPDGLIGKIGITVSPADPDRLWAIVEAEEPGQGIYRSDDAGATWRLLTQRPQLIGRPWYFHNIFADPRDSNTVYVAGGGFWRSEDGGEEFQALRMPHSDHHDLWINPRNTDILIEGNDGGAIVSLDRGESWSPQFNQPTAELYSVVVDDRFPYRVYGSQQDNSTISLPSLATGTGITLQHWLAVGGCETGPVAVRPDNPDIVYSGCFGGKLARFDKSTEQFRQIRDYPQLQDGMAERDLRYRIQWNAPITLSPHDPDVLYHGSQYVHRTTTEGQRWEIISPDLTRNDTTKFGFAGGPITHDVTGVEVYSALLVIEESPHEPGVIWTGSNDGLVHLTRDNGADWVNVTPADLPVPSTVNRIEISPHDPARAYVVAYRYRLDDFRPYIYRTSDYGATWRRIADGTTGIPADHPTRVLREDPVRPGLLYVGTEFGLFVSFDDGAHWQSLQLNLPHTPVTDLRVKGSDLVVATQGRSFWILDDVTPLRRLTPDIARAHAHLFAPRPTYRTSAVQAEGHYARDHVYGLMLPSQWKGRNPPNGVVIYYRFDAAPDGATLEILEADGDVVRAFPDSVVPRRAGMNRFVWDLRYPGIEGRGGVRGPRAVPGRYRVRLSAGSWSQDQEVEVLKDPRLAYITQQDFVDQFEFLVQVRDAVARLDEGVRAIRDARDELTGRGDEDAVRRHLEQLAAIEAELVQTRPGFSAPPKIRRHLAWIATAASSQRGELLDARPTDQLMERLGDLERDLNDALERLRRLLARDIS